MALGLGLISLLAALLVAALLSGIQSGPFRPGIGTTLLGLYIVAWGVMFLASYYFSHKTFFFRALIWVCEHRSHPKGRGMAFFYAAIAILVGGFATLTGLGLVGSTG